MQLHNGNISKIMANISASQSISTTIRTSFRLTWIHLGLSLSTQQSTESFFPLKERNCYNKAFRSTKLSRSHYNWNSTPKWVDFFLVKICQLNNRWIKWMFPIKVLSWAVKAIRRTDLKQVLLTSFIYY